MGEMHSAAARQAVELLTRGIDAVAAIQPYGLSRDDLLALTRAVETQRRRLPAVDHQLINEIDARGVAVRVGARSTASLLRDVLRLSPGEAAGRVRDASRFGPGESLSGQPIPAIFPQVAAAQAEGRISTGHAQVVARAIEALPAAVRAEHGDSVEHRLVSEAAHFDPDHLAKLARHVVAVLDPDGTVASDDDHDRCREASLTRHRDGSGSLRAHLTPIAFAKWQAVLSPLAEPRPQGDQRDERTAAQRLHDALAASASRLLRSGALPACGGTPATVLLTMTLDQLESRIGLVTTGHGGQLTVDEALRVAGEAEVIPVVIDKAGILAYGRTRRIAPAGLRRALTARDGGCVMPGCDQPPEWCEVHHLNPWFRGGKTDADELVLLCDLHHDGHEKQGWQITMIDGRPWCIPPPWIDPDQAPIRNRMHDAQPWCAEQPPVEADARTTAFESTRGRGSVVDAGSLHALDDEALQ